MIPPNDSAPELASWQRYQLEFTRHLRDPDVHPKPDTVSQQRMNVYNGLLFNNIASAVSACFPVLASILGPRKWRRLVKDFFATHRCSTPYFRQVPDEFLQYLQQEWQPDASYPDFMLELAHYEWVELALSVSNLDQATPDYDPDGDLLNAIPIVNPVMANLAYRYPVHQLSTAYSPVSAPENSTHLLVYRDADDNIRFNQQNPTTARLITLLTPARLTGGEALQQLAQDLQHPAPDKLTAFGLGLLRTLRQQGCILGTLSLPAG